MTPDSQDKSGKGTSEEERGAGEPAPRVLSDAAKRALAEAEERRARQSEAQGQAAGRAGQPQELGGRGGPDPVRYGDWENGGIASDF